MDLIFVGTGVSTAIPVMGHMSKGCACHDALNTPKSKNMRNNVSILLRRNPSPEAVAAVGDPPTDSLHNSEWQQKRAAIECNVLFDCGKTFRSAYFNVLAKMGISVVSALLITHEHADAAAGLDDLRDLIPISNTGAKLELYQALAPCPTYMTLYTLSSLARTVGYILRYSRFLNATRREGLPYAHEDTPPGPNFVNDYEFHAFSNASAVGQFHSRALPTTEEEYDALLKSTPALGTTNRRVTSLDVLVLPEKVQQFFVKGLQFPMYSFPVFHGGDYVCTAYAFGSGLTVKGSEATALQQEAATRSAKEKERRTLKSSEESGEAASSSSPSHLSYFENNQNGLDTYRSIVFLSDVSSIGADSQAFLDSLEGPVDLVIVDFLLGPNEQHFSHWCFDDVIHFTKTFRPRVVLGVGMWCTVEHAAMNALLAETLRAMKATDPTLPTEFIGLAHDGLSLKVE